MRRIRARCALTRNRPRVSYLARYSFGVRAVQPLAGGVASRTGVPSESCVEQEADGSRVPEMGAERG
jgi:hypothetical protein